MATLTGNGLMSLEDKQNMFKSMPTSGGKLIQIASVKRYTRFGAVIYNIPNNQVTQGVFLLKAGNGLTPTPTLIRLLGDNIAGSILYKMTDTTMDLFYKPQQTTLVHKIFSKPLLVRQSIQPIMVQPKK